MSAGASGRTLAIALTVIVIAAVGTGLYVAGSPRTAREEALDRRRVDDIREIEGRVKEFRRAYGTLPSTLASIESADGVASIRRDPATGEPYEYQVTGDSTFVLCATFAFPSAETNRYGSERAHPAGRHCFRSGGTM